MLSYLIAMLSLKNLRMYRYRVSLLSTECGECHPKGLIVASLYKIKIIITIIILLFTRQFSFLLDKKKNKLKLKKFQENM